MIKQFIGIVFTSAILFSCSNDIEEYMGNYPLQGELNGFDNTKETKSARLMRNMPHFQTPTPALLSDTNGNMPDWNC